MRKRYLFLSLAVIIIAGILVWACKNPHGVGIDFNERNWHISLSEQIIAHGYTNGEISYNKNSGEKNIIDPTKDTSKQDDNIKIFNPTGNNHYRIPTIITLNNDDILAFADKRYNKSGDLPNRIEVFVRKSTNNGTNWNTEKRVTSVSSSDKDGHGDVAVVQDRKTGDVLAVVAYGQGFFQSTPEDQIRIRVFRSKDNGDTWSGPVDITSQIYGQGCKDPARRSWYAAFVSSGNGLQLRNGRIMFVLNVRATSGTFVQNYIMYSDDGGYKWKVSRGAPKNTRGGNEAKVVQLNDDSLLMHIRWTPKRLESRSYDYGETWTEATIVNGIETASSSNGDLIVYTSTKNGYDRDRLITLVGSRPWDASKQEWERGPGDPMFYISYDEGRTWSKSKKLYTGSAGYSSLAVLKDGSIGILAELTRSWNGPIWFLRASVEWCDDSCVPQYTNSTSKK